MIFEAILIVVLLFLSSFFSLSETALTTVSRVKVKRFYEQKVKGAKALFTLREDPHHMLATILVANNLTNISASALTTFLTLQLTKNLGYAHAGGIGVSVATGVLTFIILVFGEITPKTIAIQRADRLSLVVAPIIWFLSVFFRPILEFLTRFSQIFIRIFGGKPQDRSPFLTAEDLKIMVTVGKEEGVLEAQEEHMIHSIMEFGDKKVTEAMTPRTEMVCLKGSEPIEIAIQTIAKEGHSRIPVYEENIDNIIGIIYAKDLLKIQGGKRLNIRDCIRPPLFIPEGKMIDELLFQMQSAKTHVAVIVDEYGGTVGMITFEDIIEEIVGEIEDEYDTSEERQRITYDGEDIVIVPAKFPIDDINELLGTELPKDDYATIGGYVFGLFGRLPARGETLHHKGLDIQIQEVRRRQITKLRIKKYPKSRREERSHHER